MSITLNAVQVTIDELVVSDRPETWRAAGFAVDDDGICRVGDVRIALVGPVEPDEDGNPREGIISWKLRLTPSRLQLREVDLSVSEIDGLPTSFTDEEPCRPGVHDNSTLTLDHLVVMSPDLERTTKAFASIGVSPRRYRDFELAGSTMRQIFFKLGDVILEVVGHPTEAGVGPSVFWGLTHAVRDIDEAALLLGANLGPIRNAVQNGRRIATVRHRNIGMSVATALISQ